MLEMVEDCSGSERELRRAIESFESMGERKSLDGSVAVLLANAYDNLGVHLAEHSRGSEGLEYHIKAVATLEPKLATATTERALYYGLRYNLGAAYFDCGNPKEAEPHLAAALDGLLAELARKPKDAMLVKEMIDSASLLARARLALGSPSGRNRRSTSPSPRYPNERHFPRNCAMRSS